MLKQFRFLHYTLWLGLFFFGSSMAAQDSVPVKKEFKNTIRFNLTNPLIFGNKSLLLGYERTFGQHQSASLSFGRASFPKPSINLLDSIGQTRIELDKSYTDKGVCVALDYRFYLKKENKYDAPHGIYIGPYYSFTHFERENHWNLKTPYFSGTLNTQLKMNIHMTGIQMGYQYILWKRVALDFILIGPGIAFYSINTSINTGLSSNDESEVLKKLQEAFSNRFPATQMIIDKLEIDKKGTTNTTSMGFRYVIHLGFRF